MTAVFMKKCYFLLTVQYIHISVQLLDTISLINE